MNTDSYKVLKLSNGEMVVCELNGHDDKMYDIMNPLKMDVVPIQSRSGIGETLNLTPWLQHFTDQEYFNIDKSHCILIADASVGLSKYYEYVMLRIDADWDGTDNLIPEEDIDEEVYDDLLREAKVDSKLIH